MVLYRRAIFQRLAARDSRDRITVLSGLQLLRAHNRYHLEDLPARQVLIELLDEGRGAVDNVEAALDGG